MELPERMVEAMKHAGVAKLFLVRELQKKRVKGSSYPTLMKYLKGKTEPNRTFLIEFSRICGVRSEWLFTESGAMTEEQEARRRQTPGGYALPKRLQETLARLFPSAGRLHRGESGMLWEVILTYTSWLDSSKYSASGEPFSNQDKINAAEQVARLFEAPLRELRLIHVPVERMAVYVAQMSLAFLSLIPTEIRRATYLDRERYPELQEPGEPDASGFVWVPEFEAAIPVFDFLVGHLPVADQSKAVHAVLDALEEVMAEGDRLPSWFVPFREHLEPIPRSEGV